MAYPHLLGLWALTFLHISFVRSLSSCNANLYGKPSVRDCFDLYDELPGGAMSANVDVDKPRSFVEPKFLEPAFCPVPNPYSTHMVQLPKVWRGGTCRYALMSIADPAGVVHEPTSIDNWRTVLNAVIDSVQSCVLEDNGAGGMRFANMDDAVAKVVYVYALGSPFEGIMNKYMSSYDMGVDPGSPQSFLSGITAGNLTADRRRMRHYVHH